MGGAARDQDSVDKWPSMKNETYIRLSPSLRNDIDGTLKFFTVAIPTTITFLTMFSTAELVSIVVASPLLY